MSEELRVRMTGTRCAPPFGNELKNEDINITHTFMAILNIRGREMEV